MHPDALPAYFRNVIAPAYLQHQKSFHALGVHYHVTPTGGEVILIVLAVGVIAAFFARLLRSS